MSLSGRSLGEGIVEFARKSSAQAALKKCQNECLLLSTTPIPVVVTPLESRDEEEGVPERAVMHVPEYRQEREVGPRFAEGGTVEWEVSASVVGVSECHVSTDGAQMEAIVANRDSKT